MSRPLSSFRQQTSPPPSQQQQPSWQPRQICDPATGVTRISEVDNALAQIQGLLSQYTSVDRTITVPRLGADGRPIIRTQQVPLPGGRGFQTRTRPEYEEKEFVDRYSPNGTSERNIDQDVADVQMAIQDILRIACMNRDDMLKAPRFDAIRVLDKPLFDEREFAQLKMIPPTALEPQLRRRLIQVANAVRSTFENQLNAFYKRLGDERLRVANLSSSGAQQRTQQPTSAASPSVPETPAPRPTTTTGPPPAAGAAIRRKSRTFAEVSVIPASAAAAVPEAAAAIPPQARQPLPPDVRSIVPPPSPFSIPARLPSVSARGAATQQQQQPPKRPAPVAVREPVPSTKPSAPTPQQPQAVPPVSAGVAKRRVSRPLGVSAVPLGGAAAAAPAQPRPQTMVDTHISEPPSPSVGIMSRPAPVVVPAPQQQQQQQRPVVPSTTPSSLEQPVRRGPPPRRARVIEEDEEEEEQINKPTQVSPPLPEHEAKRAKIELPPVVKPAIPFSSAIPIATAAGVVPSPSPPAAVSSSSSPMMMVVSSPPRDDRQAASTSVSPAISPQQQKEQVSPLSSVNPGVGSASAEQSSMDSDKEEYYDDDDGQSSEGGDSVIGSDSKFDIEVSEIEYSADQLDADIQHLINKLHNIRMEATRSNNPGIFTQSIDRLNQKINALTKFLSDQQQSGNDLFSVYFWRVLHDSTHTTLNESGPFLTELEAKQDANMFLREYEMRRDGIDRSVFVKAAQPVAQQVYKTACSTQGADLQASVVSVRVPEQTASGNSATNAAVPPASSPANTRLCIVIALPWTRELFTKVFNDPYKIYLKRFFPGSDDTIETRRQFIAFYSPAIIYAWSNAYSDITLADTLIHPVYSENILSPDANVEKMNCFGVTVAMYIFDSVEHPGDVSLAREFADSLQRTLSVRSTLDVAEKLEQVLQQSIKLQEQTIPDSSVSLMPDEDDPISISVTIKCYDTQPHRATSVDAGTDNNNPQQQQEIEGAALHCDRYVSDLYRLIYATGLRINAVNSAVIYPNGDYVTFVDLLRKDDMIANQQQQQQ